MNYKILTTTVIFIVVTLGSKAYAECTLSTDFTTTNINMAIGEVVVKPSDPVGKILRKAVFPIPSNSLSTIKCTSGAPGWVDATLTKNSSRETNVGPSIYKTNIPGIGIRLYQELTNTVRLSDFYVYEKQLDNNRVYNLGEGSFVMEIIKTSESTGSGELQTGLYSSYHLRGRSDKPILTTTITGKTNTVTSSSCEIQGNDYKTVQLPTISKARFKGIGSTQGEQAFDLNIKCNGGQNLTVPKKISLIFDYNTATNNNDVLKNSATKPMKAEGVGTQLLSQNSNHIIIRGGKVELGVLAPGNTVHYSIPLIARYYQTDSLVTAGIVKSSATVTITYD